jgi:hypothetical protein
MPRMADLSTSLEPSADCGLAERRRMRVGSTASIQFGVSCDKVSIGVPASMWIRHLFWISDQTSSPLRCITGRW